ncbi:MAG: hypothetical protein PVSMB1_07130 [Gemmatimonadaceae bacterium]
MPARVRSTSIALACRGSGDVSLSGTKQGARTVRKRLGLIVESRYHVLQRTIFEVPDAGCYET